MWANDGEQLKVDVPIVFKGLDDCPGLKKGKYTLFGGRVLCISLGASSFD